MFSLIFTLDSCYDLYMEYKNFEDNGLKIDKERVLTYSKLMC